MERGEGVAPHKGAGPCIAFSRDAGVERLMENWWNEVEWNKEIEVGVTEKWWNNGDAAMNGNIRGYSGF